MSAEYLDPISPEGEPSVSDDNDRSKNRTLLIIVVGLIVLCCCCCGSIAALYYGTEPVMDLLGIPIPW